MVRRGDYALGLSLLCHPKLRGFSSVQRWIEAKVEVEVEVKVECCSSN
jgi:hypothetical protein